ncbi:MAG: hypothetical protein EZS28_036522 [Streblomastix strix]|uniref:Protein kinase domain-containing protein n=1 Tax=Streblomastix strix TaxID=222440 RepID=A0A5J4UDJ3_9EUKA|nr:MAG: hypothetical protein EZS28_036522 [Streblomastix strix]
MMHSSNGSTKVKIADFGLAKVDAANQIGVTACGTPLNMAPELILHKSMGINKVLYFSNQELMNIQYKLEVYSNLQNDQLWNLLTKLLEFDPNRRISAAETLRHPYFTSPRATYEISIEAKRLTQNYTSAFQIGEAQFSKYNMDPTFTVPTIELLKFLNVYVEQEEQNILKAKQQQRLQQYVQSEENKQTPPVQYLSVPTPVKFNIHNPDQHKMPALIPQYSPNSCPTKIKLTQQ